MGRIVAAPTAGSAGVLPGVLLALQDSRGFADEDLARGIATAAAIGYLITRNATVSGAGAVRRRSGRRRQWQPQLQWSLQEARPPSA